jgi:uncharacterized Zn finger protein
MNETPTCDVCGSVVAFSHREYTGRGNERVVWRCKNCGSQTRTESKPAALRKQKHVSKKKPINEGPPHNPVIDSATAEMLKKLMGLDPDE